MGRTLVLCVAEVTRNYGESHPDSVMLEVDFEDEIMPLFNAHFKKVATKDFGIKRWKMTTYLPQKPLSRGKVLH